MKLKVKRETITFTIYMQTFNKKEKLTGRHRSVLAKNFSLAGNQLADQNNFGFKFVFFWRPI